jgi:hypothetical protein
MYPFMFALIHSFRTPCPCNSNCRNLKANPVRAEYVSYAFRIHTKILVLC